MYREAAASKVGGVKKNWIWETTLKGVRYYVTMFSRGQGTSWFIGCWEDSRMVSQFVIKAHHSKEEVQKLMIDLFKLWVDKKIDKKELEIRKTKWISENTAAVLKRPSTKTVPTQADVCGADDGAANPHDDRGDDAAGDDE
eukprot:7774459-Pyramimonas_sp.AAC.1